MRFCIKKEISMILDKINLNPLNILIDNHSIDIVISDIFDTIICRKIHPENIKKLVAVRLNTLFPEISSKNFYQIRKKAEHYCYESSIISYGEKELNYAAVVSTVYELLKKKYSSKIYLPKNEFYLQHQALELAIECQYQIPDTQIVDFLRTQKSKGKKIILLSDFYMNSDLVNRMLTHHNIHDIYDHLIVSCDFMKTKRSGQLYQIIISNSELCSSSNIVMIGDNYNSDIVMAEKFGIKAFYLERKQQQLFYNQQLCLPKKKCIAEIEQIINHPEDSLFDHLSLLLLIVIGKIYHHCIKHKIKKLYFFSREGKLLQDLFDQYQTFINGKSTPLPITTDYLLVSRRSTAAASLGPLKKEKFNILFRQYTNISIKQFAKSYNFEIEKISQICHNLNIDIELIQSHLPSSECFKRLKKDSQFIQYYKEFRKKQRSNFLGYLQNKNFSLTAKKLFLFDIGWKGSIQDNLNKIFPKKHLHGYYLGLASPGAVYKHNTKEGILFDFRRKNKNFWVCIENLSLFELILTANHGSVEGYTRKDDGEIIVNLENNDLEEKIFLKKIFPIQKKIFENFLKILMLLDHYSLDLNSIENYAKRLNQLKIVSPNKKEIDWFTNIHFFENFGLFTYSQIGCDIPFNSPIKNLFKLLKSPKIYRRSTFWLSVRLSQEGLGFIAFLFKCYLLYLKPILRYKR
ncbi:MAG: hypothetical protein E6K54_03195 [Gammaproteobacteria bacterium]|nr:MAG: hypothetical protein E6K54_03195 [Gammaproteobacteria bacterium]